MFVHSVFSASATQILWLSILILAAATPATRPVAEPTSRQAAEFWIKRADRDLARVATTEKAVEPGTASDISSDELALAVFNVGPNDSRRATAVRMINEGLEVRSALDTTKASRTTTFVRAAAEMAEVDDSTDSRRLMDIADAPTTLPGTDYDELLASDANFSPDYARAYVLIRSGENVSADRLPKGQVDLYFYRKLKDAGHDEEADRFRVLVESADPGRPKKSQGSRFEFLLEEGMYDYALASIDPELEPTVVFQLTNRVAESAAAAGRFEWVPKVRSELLDRSSAAPALMAKYGVDMLYECAAAGDRDGVHQIANRLAEQRAGDEVPTDETAEAVASLMLNEPDRYRVHIDRAAAAVKQMNADPHADAPTRTYVNFKLVCAYARAGDSEAVNRAIKAIETSMSEQDKFEIAVKYAEAGKYDEALGTVDKTFRKAWIVRADIARHLASAGRFDEAQKMIGTVDPSTAVETLEYIVRQRVDQHKIDGLAEWIDTIPSPGVRTVLDLAAANRILKKPGIRWEPVWNLQ